MTHASAEISHYIFMEGHARNINDDLFAIRTVAFSTFGILEREGLNFCHAEASQCVKRRLSASLIPDAEEAISR